MKANLIYTLIIASCILCSCISRPSTERKGKNLIEVDPNRDDKVSVYDLFSRIEIIPLETKQNSLLTFLIGEPDRVIVHENNFYFLDDSQHLIIVFNSEGKFLKKISKKGNGPEEYISIDDFNINRFTGNLEVLSSVGRYINVYDISGNIFIERIKFPADMPIVQNFHHLTSDVYVFFTRSHKAEIFFYSKSGNKFFMSDYSLPEWFNRRTVFTAASKNPFYVYNDFLCFEQVYNGDVFTISPLDYILEPRYLWDFGRHNFSLSVLPENESMKTYLDLLKKISADYAILFQIYKENSKYYFTRFKFKNRYKHLVFNKNKNEYILFERFREGGQCVPQWIDEDAIYTFISPSFINQVIDPSILNGENKSKYLQIKDDDNPVVVKYKFK